MLIDFRWILCLQSYIPLFDIAKMLPLVEFDLEFGQNLLVLKKFN